MRTDDSHTVALPCIFVTVEAVAVGSPPVAMGGRWVALALLSTVALAAAVIACMTLAERRELPETAVMTSSITLV